MYQQGRAWIELNAQHLVHNMKQIQTIIGNRCALMPAVKANAYGHGAAEVCRILQRSGIKDFCVASVQEGIELRNTGITGQILILCYTHPAQFPLLDQYQLTQTVVDFSYAKELNNYERPLRVHLGIDTGMRRLGEPSGQIDNILKIWRFQNLEITGVFSHLCTSDSLSEAHQVFTQNQINHFQAVLIKLRQAGICHFKTHLQGSYGILNYPDLQYDYARVGIALYGVLSKPEDQILSHISLKPVLSLKARIECVKKLNKEESIGYGLTFTAISERKIAVVSIGYADGIPRELSNKGYALLHGIKVPIIGKICMDQLTLDVTDVKHAAPGDEVVFIGKSGILEISSSEVANIAGTISNEILSRLGARLERIVINDPPSMKHFAPCKINS